MPLEQALKTSVVQLPDGHCVRRTASKLYEKALAINYWNKGKPTTWAVMIWFQKDGIMQSNATYNELARAGMIWGSEVELLDVVDKETLNG